MAAAANGGGGETKAAFARIYDALKAELLRDPAFEYTESSRQWIDRVMLPPSLPPPLLPLSSAFRPAGSSSFFLAGFCWGLLLLRFDSAGSAGARSAP